jgi:hypothetical protein
MKLLSYKMPKKDRDVIAYACLYPNSTSILKDQLSDFIDTSMLMCDYSELVQLMQFIYMANGNLYTQIMLRLALLSNRRKA